MSERAPPGVPRLERWTPPDFSRLDAVAAAIVEACPDAAPVAPLRLLGEGSFSVAPATASGAVFRLGTSPDVYARYEKEWRLLPWLAARHLPVAIPAPRWLLPPDDTFPFGGIGYPMLVGRPLSEELFARGDRAALAEQIAAFNLAMHRLPAEEALALGVPARPGATVERGLSRRLADGPRGATDGGGAGAVGALVGGVPRGRANGGVHAGARAGRHEPQQPARR